MRTIRNVAELAAILQHLPGDTPISILENRYCGGGDERYETDFIIARIGESLVIVPDCDTGLALLESDEILDPSDWL